MEFLYTLHSHNRWLICIVAIFAILKLALTWMSRGEYSKTDNILVGLFRVLLSIQFLIGLVLLFVLGFTAHRIEHGVTMFIAVGLVHSSSRWKSSPGTIRARNTLFAVLGACILIAVGISRLPQGWTSSVMP